MMISLASAVLLQFNQVGTEINARNPERRKNVISSHGICAKKTPNWVVAKPLNGALRPITKKNAQMCEPSIMTFLAVR